MYSPDPSPSTCSLTRKTVHQNSIPVERVVGLDVHPDSFTAAILEGPNPRAAIVQNTYLKVPIVQLERWVQKHTTASDTLVLEASGNSFHVARTLQGLDRNAHVLESCQVGKLKEVHANNDKISAVRIAKAFLAGTAKTVWVPDPKTQERRDWFHAHRKAVREVTRLNNRLLSYLSDNGVRPDHSLREGTLPETTALLRAAAHWSPSQWQRIEIQLHDLYHALESVQRWESLLAQEVAQDPVLLSMVRLCGVRDVVAFALGAVIGDIHRFANPRKLVKYAGLNPAFDDSGENSWSGGIGGHGHKELRALLVEAGHSILRSKHPMAQWGKKLLARKGELRLVVAALARKLLTSVWYLLMGKWDELKDIPKPLVGKLGKIISRIGKEGLANMGKTRKSLREEMEQSLRSGRIYYLDPDRKFEGLPASTPGKSEASASLASEYGIA